MKLYSKLLIALISVALLNSCTNDDTMAITGSKIQESRTITLESSKTSVFDYSEEMNQNLASLNKSADTPPVHKSNNGLVNKSLFSPSDTDNFIENLSFGTRAEGHTTQWIDVTIDDRLLVIDALNFDSSIRNSGAGRVAFSLNGIAQTVNLDYKITIGTPTGRRFLITPSVTNATFLRDNVPPKTIDITKGNIKLTIHANEFGWLWLRIKQGSQTLYSRNYRFTYSSSNNSQNGVAYV